MVLLDDSEKVLHYNPVLLARLQVVQGDQKRKKF
jgi:hypothetical protein